MQPLQILNFYNLPNFSLKTTNWSQNVLLEVM